MPAEVTRPKPVTRSSIRHSLGLASVGKAIADVMHSTGEKDKAAKKSKEAPSRRTSLAPPRISTELTAAARKDKVASPDTKTTAKSARRLSTVSSKAGTTSSEDQSSSPSGVSPKGPVTRSSTLRPRSSLASSALPKYRPRSVLVEVAKKPPSSPARAGIRRRLSSSDDEGDDDNKGKGTLHLDPSPTADKFSRAISPLPHRAALKVNLTAAINIRPATPDRKVKSSSPTPKATPTRRRVSPPQPQKTTKTSAARSAVARPPSSTSSSSSPVTPRTPKTPTFPAGGPGRSGGSARQAGNQPSPLRTAAFAARSDSPLERLSARKAASTASLSYSPATPLSATPTIITEGNSIDSMEANDVEFMLSSVVSPSAPTPALPRFRTMPVRDHDADGPRTPTRPSPFLPTRANLSYLSPAPPNESSPFLRPRSRNPGNDRGSILSFEQLALHNKSFGVEDIENILSDIPAPFRSGAVSPALSATTDLPDSPTFSSLPSPSGYGSISQVLLPDVTPSPAVHNLHRYENISSEGPAVDAAIVTLLRLQLASAENIAKERLNQIQTLESQLHSAKEARLRDAEALSWHVSELEQQVHGNWKSAEYAASLEEQLKHAQAAREQAVSEAWASAQGDAAASQAAALKKQRARSDVSTAACQANAAWIAVRDTAEGELELLRSNREMLAVLLAGLDQSRRLHC